MLTARSAETDEIVGFNMGADDYVTKPFRVQPLIHRIKALLRRTEAAETGKSILSLQGVEIDRTNHTARYNGVDLDLTPTEFRMLWTMMSQPGRAFSRNELMETSRGEDANSLERTIDVHVRALRKKLGDNPDLIETFAGLATASFENRSGSGSSRRVREAERNAPRQRRRKKNTRYEAGISFFTLPLGGSRGTSGEG